MRLLIVAALAAPLVLGACSKPEQDNTEHQVKDATASAVDKTREAVSSPQVKEVGSELKEAGGNAVAIAKGAVEGAKDAAAEAKAEKKAKDDKAVDPDSK
jgi:hypothetical protein